MYIKILRGIGQIGGNIVEIGTQKTKIIFDCGKNLPEIGETYQKDDIKIDGLNGGASSYNAVFLTHYHGDHVGLIDTVNADIPIYASTETVGYVDFMSEHFNRQKLLINTVKPDKTIKIGDIEVTPITAKHSAKGALMYLISADGKNLLYTGDFSSPVALKQTQIDVMLCEGTNIGFESGKIRDEASVKEEIYNQIKGEDKPCFVVASSANVDRVESILNACERSGKTLLVELFTYSLLRALHTQEEWENKGFDKILFYSNEHTDNMKSSLLKNNHNKYINNATSIYDSRLDPTKLVAFVVKSNIKPVVHRSFHQRDLEKIGVKIIYSLWTGYKKEAQLSSDLSFLQEQYNAQIVDIHASGHITKENLKEFVAQINPKTIIPIHTQREDVFIEEFTNIRCLINDEIYEV